MVSIRKGRDVLTLVNVFTVKPENQQKLVTLLTEATDNTFDPILCEVSESVTVGE